MSIIASPFILFMLFSIFHGSVEDTSVTSTPVSVTAVLTTNSNTNQSTLLLCPGGHINPPNCTQCVSQSESNDIQCNEIKNQIKSSRATGRRTWLIIVLCLLSTLAILSMLMVYVRFNHRHGVHSLLSTEPNKTTSTHNANTTNRVHSTLRTKSSNNPNKRRLLNYFSRSNKNQNNNLSEQHRQPYTSHAGLNENLDEALLFDDPYADGTLNSGSVNPYQTLTLSIN